MSHITRQQDPIAWAVSLLARIERYKCEIAREPHRTYGMNAQLQFDLRTFKRLPRQHQRLARVLVRLEGNDHA